jgi:hypothetical protein
MIGPAGTMDIVAPHQLETYTQEIGWRLFLRRS